METQTKSLSEISVKDFLHLMQLEKVKDELKGEDRKTVYGLAGIASLFGCSIATANRIKKSGAIAPAITQIGRKIIVDAPLALFLASQKKGGRR